MKKQRVIKDWIVLGEGDKMLEIVVERDGDETPLHVRLVQSACVEEGPCALDVPAEVLARIAAALHWPSSAGRDEVCPDHGRWVRPWDDKGRTCECPKGGSR